MRAQWCALHTDLMRSTDRIRFQTEFIDLRREHATLRDLRDTADLMNRLHAQGGDPARRNTILQALVIVAQGEVAPQTATTLLLLALWPGLDAVHSRLCRDFPHDRADIGSDIAAQVTIGIRKLDLSAVQRIASTLIKNTERDLRRIYVRVEALRRVAMPLELIESAFSVPSSGDPADVQRDWQQLLTPVLGRQTALFLRIIYLGETQAEAGAALGLSHDAARKRFQRALSKLRSSQKPPPGLSHSDAPVGL